MTIEKKIDFNDIPNDHPLMIEYQFMPELHPGDTVKLNHHFFRKYQYEELLDETYIIVSILGNNITLSNTIAHFGQEINRYYLNKVKNNRLKIKEFKREIGKSIVEETEVESGKIAIPKSQVLANAIKKKEAKENPSPAPEPIKLTPSEELMKDLKYALDNNGAINDFFTLDEDGIESEFINRVNKMKTSQYEKSNLIKKIRDVLKQYKNK